ncbi:integral membrane protein 2C-like isoform X2 [Hippocampus zosterae]|uniref:integral membrane protein 2C-like isoform X2 n=1 Tax=Hippocampus zosterae TaxID=109293 RepID=UPI00223D127F|nr:integral membrane protein 2C-like isoform X2 [Hippocampus zosterae]
MVRIFFRASSSDKGDKEEQLVVNELDRDQDLESTSARIKRYFPVRLCVAVFAVLVILLGLLLGSIYTYRHFHPSKESLEVFKCHVMFDDYNHQLELTMEVAVSLQQWYEYIKVVKMGGRDNPYDIIHDFKNSKTAYYDKQLSKCFVGPLSSAGMSPPYLLEKLTNTKSEIYLADNYVLEEVMKVTGPLTIEEMTPTIQEMCRERETFEMQRGDPAIKNDLCREIIDLDRPYIVITYMCP